MQLLYTFLLSCWVKATIDQKTRVQTSASAKHKKESNRASRSADRKGLMHRALGVYTSHVSFVAMSYPGSKVNFMPGHGINCKQ